MIERVSLNALKFFYYVCLYGNATIAAQKLYVTQSAVSKQIKNLETLLNIALFDRVNKTLKLTIAGEKLYTCCEQVFSELDSCLLELEKPEKPSQLVLSCEPTLSMKWLIPRLSKFNQCNHGFEIVLLTAGGAVDFRAKGIDIALRRDDFAWGNHVIAEKLVDESMVAVFNPHVEAKPMLLLSSSRPKLERFVTRMRNPALTRYEKCYLEHFYLCIEAALAGLGTAIVSKFMVEKELENGLLAMANSPIFDNSAYYLLSERDFNEDNRKKVFLDWLKTEMHDSVNFRL